MKNLPSILTIFLSTIIAQPELNIPDNISFQGFLTQVDFLGSTRFKRLIDF